MEGVINQIKSIGSVGGRKEKGGGLMMSKQTGWCFLRGMRAY